MVIIIGILAAIAIPIFLNQRAQAQRAAAQSDLRHRAAAATAYSADRNGSYVGCTDEELVTNYGWNKTPEVTSSVTENSATRWVSTAAHNVEGTDYTFSTDTGVVVGPAE